MDNLVIDNNWLTSVLSIAASAYIFLLGIPTLISQTYMPEELREIYIKRKDTRKNLDSLRQLGFALIFLILVVTLGNIGLPLVWHNIGNPQFFNEEGLCNYGYCLFWAYYIFISTLLLVYAYFIYIYIMKQINVGNIRKQIIGAVISDAKNYYTIHNKINRDDIHDFQVMGKSFSAGLKKKELLQELLNFTRFIVNSNEYKGLDFDELLNDVFIEAFCYNSESSSSSNLATILDICKQIPNDPLLDLSPVDRQRMAILVDKIAHIAIEKDYRNIFYQSFELLKKLPNTDDMLFEICKRNNKIERYAFVQQKIIGLSKNFRLAAENITENKVRHMLCYLSWFFLGHEHMQHFTEDKINELIDARILSQRVFTDAITFFQQKADYDSAYSINKLRQHFYPT